MTTKRGFDPDSERNQLAMEYIYPGEWQALARDILDSSMIMVIGGTDTGKSTFVRYLANEMLASGKRVAIANADVGQSDIGPPSTISVALLRNPFSSYEQLSPDSLHFTGSVSPSGNCISCIAGIQIVVDHARERNAQCIIVNTTGWIGGYEAREYKLAKISMLSPATLVAFQRENELSHILRPFRRMTRPGIFILPVSPHASSRSPEIRYRLRMEKYRRYFQGSSLHLVSWRHVAVTGLQEEDLKRGEFNGLLAGLFDKSNLCRGIGILRGAEVSTAHYLIQAHATSIKNLARVHFGQIYFEETIPAPSS